MSGSQVEADVQMFTENLAEATAAPKKSSMKQPKQSKAEPPLVIPEADDTEKRAAILRKISAYMQEFPQRLQHIKIPKTFGERATLDELKLLLADVEHELGKGGALDYVRQGFVKVCEGIESFNGRTKVLPYNLSNFGSAAVISVNDFQLADGTIQRGNMIPLLKEFSIKYSDWFSSRVEMRILVAMMGMMAEVHRMNSEAPAVAEKAEKKTSAKTSAAAKNL